MHKMCSMLETRQLHKPGSDSDHHHEWPLLNPIILLHRSNQRCRAQKERAAKN
uniref:Uncharacterized protein n=1 Tax=Arundo donax TaxID=35708 RepID=A0A0A9DEZ0_ARUDO